MRPCRACFLPTNQTNFLNCPKLNFLFWLNSAKKPNLLEPIYEVNDSDWLNYKTANHVVILGGSYQGLDSLKMCLDV